MPEPTISAYMQCASNKAALYSTLHSFRTAYPIEPITLVSDAGEDFSRFATRFGLRYYRSEKRSDPRERLGRDGTLEYLRRIYDHSINVSSDYVVILEEDVTTLRRIRRFPSTTCGGPRSNALAAPLNDYLRKLNETTVDYGYAMCGGSIFERRAYVECYERQNFDVDFLQTLDEAVVRYSDVALTVIFLINGYSYGEWDEVSEIYHPIVDLRIHRDSAFDHADKRLYGAEFDETLLDLPPERASS